MQAKIFIVFVSKLIYTDQMPAPLSKNPPSISVMLTPAEMATLREVANRYRVSPAGLAQLAVRQLLAHARAGATPLIAPFDSAGIPDCTSIEVTSWT